MDENRIDQLKASGNAAQTTETAAPAADTATSPPDLPSQPDGTAVSANAPAVTPPLAGAQTYWEERGTLIYALRYADGLRYVTSKREQATDDRAKQMAVIVSQPSRRTRFSRDACERFLKGKAIVDPQALLEELRALFRDHVYWKSPHMPVLLAVWVIGTYVFQVFTYFPYLALNSAVKRSGKSLVLHILSELAFNAMRPMVGATPAVLFRDSHANSSTQLLDEVETLTDADSNGALMRAVLCGGFQKGGTVQRCDAQNGTYTTPTEYVVYSPKAFAGINEVAAVVRDRSLSIRMERKPSGIVVARFSVRAQARRLQEHRDNLHIFGLQQVAAIVEAYEHAETLPLPEGLDDRGRDICEPLFAIAHVIGPEAEQELARAVEEIAAERRADDTSTEGDLPAARAILLAHLADQGTDEIVLTTTDALAVFRDAGLIGIDGGERDVQPLLRRLGCRSGTHRRDGQVVRGYKINRAKLEDQSDAA